MRRLRYETRLLLLALGVGLPGVAAALPLLWLGPWGRTSQVVVTAVLLAAWGGLAWVLRERVAYTLRTVANLLEALRREDFAIRARRGPPGDALDAVFRELNDLAETLKTQRLGALEASALLRRVMASIDVAVFAFDPGLPTAAGAGELCCATSRRLTPAAPSWGSRRPSTGRPPDPSALPRLLGTWGVRRSLLRRKGCAVATVVADLRTRCARKEPSLAAADRVLGHELNNSLAPIKSMAATLQRILERRPPPDDRDEDLARGLAVIEQRAASLSRFLAGYSRLAQLPPPRLERTSLAELCGRAAALETGAGGGGAGPRGAGGGGPRAARGTAHQPGARRR